MQTVEEEISNYHEVVIKDLLRINSKLIHEKMQLKKETIELSQEVKDLTDQNTKLYQQIGLISIELHKKLPAKRGRGRYSTCIGCQGNTKYYGDNYCEKCWNDHNA
jgi:hypothetical protein